MISLDVYVHNIAQTYLGIKVDGRERRNEWDATANVRIHWIRRSDMHNQKEEPSRDM